MGDVPVHASLTGILRGLIREGFLVKRGMKIADIDPRIEEKEACYRRSDKAIAIGKGILQVLEKHIRTQYLLKLDVDVDKVIVVVGGGGKTTLIYELAEELASNGKDVIVTTTTHMMKPLEGEHGKGIRTIGSSCMEEPEKIQGLPKDEYERLKAQCDVLLVEADGAKGKPLKAPAEHEPVIPEDADVVIGIAGASAVGKTIRECCHRGKLVSEVLGVTEEHLITEEDVIRLLGSPGGQKKNVTVEYRMVVGQADLLSEKQRRRFREYPGIILWSGRE